METRRGTYGVQHCNRSNDMQRFISKKMNENRNSFKGTVSVENQKRHKAVLYRYKNYTK